jgi:predicted TIM-barrel fold metal-dependent hydrolase
MNLSPDPFSTEPILMRARQGQPLGELVIDAHGHLGAWPQFYIPRTDPASLVEVMDRCGVRAIAISGMLSIGPDYRAGNQAVAEAADAFPGRFIGYVTLNPNYPGDEAEREIEFWLTRHPWMRGIKLHPAYHEYPINGPAYRLAFEAAKRHRVPVLSHTWGVGEENWLCGPAMFADLAEAYPEVNIILGHAGGRLPGYRAAAALAQSHPNVYLETCGSFQALGLVEFLVEAAGSERVLFGSDACFLAQTAELGRVVFCRLSTADKRNILVRNAARLFHYPWADKPIEG